MKDKEKQFRQECSLIANGEDLPTDKQIEEMAKIIDDRLLEARNWFGSMNKGEGYWIAQELVKHYQPKIPEDSVVLTMEEQEKILKATEKRIEQLKEENGQLRLENNDLEAQVNNARKETAEKILRGLSSTKIKICNDYYIFAQNIDVLAKEYGVEAGE